MTPNDFIGYNTTGAQPYDLPTILKPVENCNGFVATNVGTTTVTINGHILYPGTPGTNNGDAFTFGGNAGEVFRGNISIFFGAGVTPLVTIDQKFYNLEK